MLLGDVGTGKTMVAAFALVMAADSGEQALMMGPTEVLVDQYAQGLGPFSKKSGVTWAKLTGSTPASEREAILEGLASARFRCALARMRCLWMMWCATIAGS